MEFQLNPQISHLSLSLSAGAQIHSLTHGKNIESLGLGLKTKSKDLEVATPQISQKI